MPTEVIIAEIDDLLENEERVRDLDFFTITASGEPTLHTGIGRIIRHIKEKTDKPVAILTNGSLLYLKEVREDLSQADIVIPSLDGARQESFRKVNRPAKCSADLEAIIEGIAQFSHEFSGEVWLEILLVENMNDTPDDITAFKNAIERISPTRVQLNTVARPPYESFAKPLTRKRMEKIKEEIEKGYVGDIDILAGSKETEVADKDNTINGSSEQTSPDRAEDEIIEMVLRRPSTAADIAGTLNLGIESASEIIRNMESRGDLIAKIHGGKKYFRTTIGQTTENE